MSEEIEQSEPDTVETVEQSAIHVTVVAGAVLLPVFNASVSIDEFYTANTNEEGKAIFNYLAPGEYTVTVESNGYDGHALKVNLSPESTRTTVQVELQSAS